MLRETIDGLRLVYPFKIHAGVLLPDHMHCIWELPEENRDYSKLWGMIKAGFTKKVHNAIRDEGVVIAGMLNLADNTESRKKHGEANIWQRRFCEHQSRDQRDFNNHCDYIHYNPVKHGYAATPTGWKYSTIHRFIRQGIYHVDWGVDGMQHLQDTVGME